MMHQKPKQALMSVSKWVSDETTAKYKPTCEQITSNPLRGMDE
jgi:hypothetical protein